MATNVDEEVTHVDTECTALLTDEHTNTSHTGNGQSGVSRRTRLVNLGKLLLHLVCLAYSLYLIWLLAYLKDNKNYWFLSFIPLVCNFLPFLWFCKAWHDNDFPKIGEGIFIIYDHSCGVGFNLMACFTMLTRQAYYHHQPDEFIGPGFIILSLKASIILILLNFLLHIVGKRYSFLDYKDAHSHITWFCWWKSSRWMFVLESDHMSPKTAPQRKQFKLFLRYPLGVTFRSAKCDMWCTQLILDVALAKCQRMPECQQMPQTFTAITRSPATTSNQ